MRQNDGGWSAGFEALGGRARAILLTVLVAGALCGCAGPTTSVMNPAGPVGAQEKTIILDCLAIMMAIVGPTILATLGTAFWFRERNKKAAYRPDFAYSGRLELLIWSIPALTVLFLGGICWIGSHDLDPARPLASKAKPLEVEVVSLDWKWLFIYPEQGVASVNQLVAPVGAPIHFKITSASVFNVFFIPRLGSEIYAMNGMATNLNLLASAPGDYYGLSAHYSGDGFSTMHFDFKAVPPAAFANFVETAKARGPVLDAGGYAALSKPSANVAPFTYRAIDPGLFEAVVDQKIPQEEGPEPTFRPETPAGKGR